MRCVKIPLLQDRRMLIWLKVSIGLLTASISIWWKSWVTISLEKLVAAFAQHLPANNRLDILDAGCGTGLCGPYLRPFARSLTGVDLADKMLDRAKDRALVRHAYLRGEITAYLNRCPGTFDAIIAADVIIYFGDLVPLATALWQSLRPNGLLAFSTESAISPGHHLLTSGRFAHSVDYIRSVFAGSFTELTVEETQVRLEAERQVAGNLFVFARNDSR